MKPRINPFLRSALLFATVAFGITHTVLAVGTVTWKSGGTANWNVAGNWTAGTGGTAPPATGDSLAFGATTGVTTLNNDITSGSFAALTFSSTASAYTLNGNAITLTGNITNNSSNLQTINLAIATTAVRTVTTNASGNITLGGVISGTSGGITKAGAGTLTLTAANTYTGATTVNLGTLVLDFSAAGAPATNIINNSANSSALTLGGGILDIKFSNSATANTQRFNNLTLTASTNSKLQVTQNSNSNAGSGITLAGITRNAGSTLDLTLPTTGSITTTSTTSVSNSVLVSAATNGIAYATSGGTDWVTNTAGTLGALSSYATGNVNYVAASNIDVTSGDSVSGVTVNTLRFNGNNSLTLAGANTVSTGGILVTSAANTGASITGGSLQAGGGKELVIINSGVIDIGSNIIDNATASAVTISGSGVTTLSGVSNTYTGKTTVLGGATLKAGSTQAFGTGTVTLAGLPGATVDLNGNNLSIGSLAGGSSLGGTVALGTKNLTITGATTGQTYSGVFTGSGNIVINAPSANTVQIGVQSGAVSTAFTGNVDVQSGIFILGPNHDILGGNSGGTGTQSITVASGATAKINAANAGAWKANQNFIINGTGGDGNGALQYLNYNYGAGNIGGVAVATSATVLVAPNTGYGGGIINVNGPLAGTGTLTLSGTTTGYGAGKITLTKAAGTIGAYSAFSGDVNLRNNITLTSNNATALGTVGKLDIADGTSFAIGASQTIGALTETTASTFTATVSLGTSILTIGNASNLDSVFSGVISSGTAGGVTKAGSGTLTLKGANTYTGTTLISEGLLKVSGGSAISDSGLVSLANVAGATFQVVATEAIGALTGGGTTGGTVSIDASQTLTLASGTQTFGGKITGSGSLRLNNSAVTQTLTGNNDYAGATTINFGVLNIQHANALGDVANGTTVANGATLKLQTSSLTSFAAEALTLSTGNSSTVILQNVSGDNTWKGTIGVNASSTGSHVVRISSDSGLLTLADTITLSTNAANQFVLQGAGNIDVTGKITGASMVSGGATGSGIRKLSNATNDYTGNTNVNGGTLQAGVANAIPYGTGKGNLVINAGASAAGVFDLNGNDVNINGLSGTSNTVLGKVVNNGSATTKKLTVGNGDATASFAGILADNNNSGTGVLAIYKTGSGAQTLSGPNTYTGATSINGGTLSISSLNSVVANTSALLTSSSLGAPITDVNGTIGMGSAAVTGRLLYTGTGETTNRILSLNGETGGAILDQSGATGLLKFTSNLAAPGVTDKDVRKTLTLQGSTAGTGEIEGIIADSTLGTAGQLATSLTKTGTGTWTLSGANTYTGATNISQGTLVIGAGGGIANSSTIHVASGATYDVSAGSGNTVGALQTLTGTGTVKGDISVNGTLEIGSSPGTMIFKNDLTLGGVSNFEFTLASFASGSFDLAQSAVGSVSFGGILNLYFDLDETYAVNSSVPIFDFYGGYSGDFSEVKYYNLGAGQSATFDETTGIVTVIPEPRAALLGGLGLLPLLRRRRAASVGK